MGVCLCKDKVEEGFVDDSSRDSYAPTGSDTGRLAGSGGGSSGGPNGQQQQHHHHHHNHHIRHYSRSDRQVSLSDTVDALVKETLEIIRSIVDNEPETPSSMVMLHDLTDKPSGWIQLVKSLIRVVPLDNPMGPSVITLLLDDSPLPSKESVLEVADMITRSIRRTPKRERNMCIILGFLAERLAGPCSISALSEVTLGYLLGNLDEGIHPDVMLFSLIALEKFAQTSENKSTIRRKLALYPDNPLLRLERHITNNDFTLRQVGFCAQWCLDNYFLIDGRQYSYEVADVSNVNVMLNTRDVSEYLKISADGLTARCDAYSFESVRCTYQVNAGCWYYEVLIMTPGVMQIGWATKDSNFLSHEGYGIGDDAYSIAFDGCRKLIWHKAKPMQHNLNVWSGGSVLGCLLDLDAREVIFSLDGVEGEVLKQLFESSDTIDGFFAAASFMSFQQCRFNFGSTPFVYPPKNRPFKSFNDHAALSEQDKIVLPRHLFLEQLRKLSVREDSCTLCFDMKATIRIEPCQHRGFCTNCAALLQFCPMCRADIVSTVQEETPPDDTSPGGSSEGNQSSESGVLPKANNAEEKQAEV